MPLVSVVIPIHNRPDMLAEALDSVIGQTFKDYEIIVISNGENQAMQAKSQAMACIYGAIYYTLHKGNVSVARNLGIERARGEWIALLDDDDLWLPNKLEKQLEVANSTSADMIVCDYVEFFPDGKEITRGARLYPEWTYHWALSRLYWWAAPSATLIRKSVITHLEGFDSKLRYSEDNDMWRRISWSNRINEIHDILVKVRRGHSSLTTYERRMKFYDLIHYAKMCRDTPYYLRRDLPSIAAFVPQRLIIILAADWMLNLLHRIGPRRRLLNLWLRWRSNK